MIKYVISYLGVAFFACAIIGITIFAISSNELNQVATSEIEKRMQGIADDFSAQMSVMQEVALEIAFTPEYKLSYVSKHKYREIELLADLYHYKNYTPLAEQLFLFYQGQDVIYLAANKVTSHFAYFARDYLACYTEEKQASLYRRIAALEEPDVICADNGNLLFCYPIHHDTLSDASAFVCFMAKQEAVLNRICLIGGEFGEGTIRLVFNERCIFGPLEETAKRVCQVENGIRVELISEESLPYSGIKTYTSLFGFVTIAVLAATCVVAIAAANRNYRPIRELVNEFAVGAQAGENEFHSLQMLLKHNIESNRINQEQVQENMRWLERQRRRNNEQMMMLALSGNLHGLPLLGDDENPLFKEGKYFNVVCLSVSGKQDFDDFFARIAELGDRGTQLYGVRLPYESLVAVVISFEETQAFFSAIELLRGLLEALEMDARLSMGTTTDTLNHIPDSFAAALMELNTDAKQASRQGEWYDEAAMKQLLAFVKEGRREQVRETTEMIFAQIEESNPSVLIRSCAYSNVINTIIRVAVKSGVDISAYSLSIVLLYNQPAKIKERIFMLLDELCSCFLDKKGEHYDMKRDALIAYIQSHYCEYGLCLTQLEEMTGMSVRQIEQMLRMETGMTFKEYLTTLRMEEAKRLLRSGRSVNETSQTVCYMSVSFFIKTFKKSVGMTPAEYRKSLEQEAGAALHSDGDTCAAGTGSHE